MHYGYFPVGVQSAKQLFFFFLNSVLQQDVCAERKMYFSRFSSVILSVFTLTPDLSIDRSRMPS